MQSDYLFAANFLLAVWPMPVCCACRFLKVAALDAHSVGIVRQESSHELASCRMLKCYAFAEIFGPRYLRPTCEAPTLLNSELRYFGPMRLGGPGIAYAVGGPASSLRGY
jgi:hypothetical protein